MKHDSGEPSTARAAWGKTPDGLAFLADELDGLERQHLLRVRHPAQESPGATFCSNDYLGLADRPANGSPSGSGASRLVLGDRAEHVRLEQLSAALVRQSAALSFTSGYAANVGLLQALAERGDLIVSDRLNHASIIDGARLSGAQIAVVPHLDLEATEQALAAFQGRRRFVVTESYFSMDADAPDLRMLRCICDAHGAALLVDEAHALGVLGPEGRGLAVAAGVSPDAVIGTYGKAFGAAGAFVAGCSALIGWLWNRARSFVFSTGLSPALAAAAADGLVLASSEAWRRSRVLRNAERLRAQLAALRLDLRGFGPVIPWVLGEPARATSAADYLARRGVVARAIRPPTVPTGTARIRFTVTSAHRDDEIDQLAATVSEWVSSS